MRDADALEGASRWMLVLFAFTCWSMPGLAAAQDAGAGDATSTTPDDVGAAELDTRTPPDGDSSTSPDATVEPTQTPPPPDDTSSSTSEAARETTLPGGTLAVVSYIVLWIGMLAFVGYLGWRQRQLADEVESLEGRLDEAFEEAVDLESKERDA